MHFAYRHVLLSSLLLSSSSSLPHHPRLLHTRPAPCHLCLLSGSVLALSRLSLSPINKIAHLPRKLIACLNFSGGRQPTFSTANACRFSVARLLFFFFFAGRSRAKCARFRGGRRFENDFNRSALAYNADASRSKKNNGSLEIITLTWSQLLMRLEGKIWNFFLENYLL